MGGGYTVARGDAIDQLFGSLRDLRTQVQELQRPDGSQLADAVKTLTQLVDDLPGQIFAILATSVDTGTVNATGDVNAAGTVTGTTGVSSTGSYNLDVSGLAGSRRTMWIHQSGAMGYAPSTRDKKTNIRPYDKPASAFLACQPKMFEYIAQVDIRDNPQNPDYNPDYVVPTDVGELAEDLLDNGLGEFVFYEMDNATVAGIDYISFCAVGMLVIGIDHETRIKALENTTA